MKGTNALEKLASRSCLYLRRNSSTILTVVGAVGVVATSVTAVQATPKALMLLENAKKEKGEELTKFEVVRIAGPAYIPSVAIGASTLACIFGANVLNKKKQAALVSAYALADNTYKEYRDKVRELLGEETDDRIISEIAKDKRDEEISAYTPGLGSLPGSGEKCLFYEQHRGKYFEATMNDVLNAEYHLNRNFALRGCAALNEFYEFLGLEQTDFGDVLGWSAYKLAVDYDSRWIDFTHQLTNIDDGSTDGMDCYIIGMVFPPEPEWEY